MEMHFDKFEWIYKEKVNDCLIYVLTYHLESVFVKNNDVIPTKKYLLGSHYMSWLCSVQKPTETFAAD